MKKEDLDRIADYFIRNTSVKMEKTISKDDFYKILDRHPEGRKRVESLWQSELDEGEFPPKELSLMSYYFMLLDLELITEYQYDQLVNEI
jgi:hypothetical protein